MSDYSATTNAYMSLAASRADAAYKNQYLQSNGLYNPTTSYSTTTSTIFPNTTYANNVNFAGNYTEAAAVGTSTDGADDGKLSFGETVGNFFKGLVSPVTSLFESPGNFIKGVAIMGGCALLCVATGGAAAPLLVAGGCALGGFQAVKGVIGAANAKTEEEARQAWQSIGAGTGAIAMSVAGAKSAAKAGGIYEEGMTSLQATKACITNVGKSASASLEAFTSGQAMSNLKAAFGAKGKTAVSENKAPAEKTATELYEEGAPDAQVAEQAKAERLSHKSDKIDISRNPDSPQADIYKEVNEISADSPDYLEYKAQRNARVSERMELDADQLGDAIEYQRGKAVEAKQNGYKGAQKVANDNARMYEREYEQLTGHKYESPAASEPVTPSKPQTVRASKSDTLHSFDELQSYLDEGAFETAPETPVRYEIKMEKIPTDINNTTSIESFKANGGTFDGNTALNPDGTGFTGRINNGAGYETVYRDGNIVDVGPSAQTSGTSTSANTGTNANTSTGTSTNAGANASTEASAPQVKGKPNHSNTNGSQAGRPSRIDRFNKRYGNQGAGTSSSQAGAAQTPVSSATKLSGNFSERLQGIKGKIGQESFARNGLSQRISAFKGLKQETISAMPDEFIIDSLNNSVNSSKFVESLGTLEQEFTSTELSNLFGKYYGREYAHMYCRGQYNSPAAQQQILQAMRSLAGKKAA